MEKAEPPSHCHPQPPSNHQDRHPPVTHYKFIPQKILLPPPPLPPQGWALGSPLAPALPALGLDLLWWSVAGGGQDPTNKKTSRKKSDLMLGRGAGGRGQHGGGSQLISWLWQSFGEG